MLEFLKFVLASVLILPAAFGQLALTTAQIAKRVSPSVVVIQGKTPSGDVLGSGFIVSKDGKIVTNLHVIRELTTASVQTANGEIFDSVSVLATDERRDLAIVKVAGFDLPVLDLGNSDGLTVGEPLVVVGSPRGLEGTVTAGILSSVRDSGEGFRVLQTDASVNPGNSGGPLVNNKGQAIGVVSFKLRSAENLNFAIPINYVRGLLSNLGPTMMTLEQMRRSLPGAVSVDQPNNTTPPKGKLEWSTESMLSACKEIIEAKSDDQGNAVFPRDFETGQCWGAFSLLWYFGRMTGVDTGEAFVSSLCLPKGTTVIRVISVFSAYAKKHPELYNEDAFVVALNAMPEVFPCKVPPVDVPSVDKQSGGPSLKDTLDWLKETIPLGSVTYRYQEFSENEHAAVLSLNSCRGVFDKVLIGTTVDQAKNRFEGTSRYSLNLGVLSRVVVSHMENLDYVDSDGKVFHRTYVGGERWAYRVYLASKSRDITLESFPTSQWPEKSTSHTPITTITGNFYLSFSEEATANRVAEAFKHAASLCEKADVF